MQRTEFQGFRRFISKMVAAVIGVLLSGGVLMAEASEWRVLEASDGAGIHYEYWAAKSQPHAVVQVVHGAAEHSGGPIRTNRVRVLGSSALIQKTRGS